MSENKTSLSYKDAGVDIDAGNQLVDRIKSVTKRTHRPEVKGNLGEFGALCSLPTKYKNPVLVSGTDDVGTKLGVAMDANSHDGVGIYPGLNRKHSLGRVANPIPTYGDSK